MKKIVLIMGFLITIAMATQLDIKLLDQKCNRAEILMLAIALEGPIFLVIR